MGFGLTVQTFCLLMYDKEKHQNLTFKQLEPRDLWHFCLKHKIFLMNLLLMN